MGNEIEALKAADEALEPLSDEGRQRVIAWLLSKYSASSPEVRNLPQVEGGGASPASGLGDFGDVFHKFDPSSEGEKALIAAYYKMRDKGENSFSSQEINTELKSLGYGVKNITDAISSCMAQKPALIIQLKKSGSSKQARKVYKITDAGIRYVENRLFNEGAS